MSGIVDKEVLELIEELLQNNQHIILKSLKKFTQIYYSKIIMFFTYLAFTHTRLEILSLICLTLGTYTGLGQETEWLMTTWKNKDKILKNY